jgi:hypothetical protein
MVDAVEGDYASRLRSATSFRRGALVSVPLWILLPVGTPVGVIVAALTLQRLERTVLVSRQDAVVHAGLAQSPTGVHDGP